MADATALFACESYAARGARLPAMVRLALLAAGLAFATAAQPGSAPVERIVGTSTLWGGPTTHATVEIRHTDDGPVVGASMVETTGRFRIRAVQPGTYLLRITWPGMAIAQRIVDVPAAGLVTLDVTGEQACPPAGEAISDDAFADAIRLVLTINRLPPSSSIEASAARRPLLVAERLPRAWLSRLHDLPLDPMNAQQLQLLADRSGPVDYISVHDVRATGACATVSVTQGREVASAEKRHAVLLGGSTRTYRFIRRRDRWEFDLVSMTEV